MKINLSFLPLATPDETCYNTIVFDLSAYAKRRICVAVSGGRDSMALINFIYARKDEYGITLSALNCDHGMRGDASARDSAFVAEWCKERDIPLLRFVWDFKGNKTEQAARLWRLSCYDVALKNGADCVACAHHMDDNVETVLFNLARGSAAAGLSGICDGERIIHPMISCTRKQIDDYIKANSVPYRDDETNFTEAYTRNKIRLKVLPELQSAVPGAVGNIYRLSRLVAEDEKYFQKLIEERNILKKTFYGVEIARCESVVFKRAAVRAIKSFMRKDYTCEQLERLCALEKGKKFEFLNLTAYGGEDGVIITEALSPSPEIPFSEYCGDEFGGRRLVILDEPKEGVKSLKFDRDALPATAALRFRRDGDVFTKFGGGTKSLGDYFTDKKIPPWLRGRIPLVADGRDVLAVCGEEISDKIKVTEKTVRVKYIICE